MSTRHIAAEHTRLHDLTPEGSSGRASKRFRRKLAADGFTVDEGFQLKPGYLYTVVRAISARVNQNWDGWPSDELKKSYKTFIGKPVFVNHENHDPTKARGVVVAARYVENGMDKYIEVVQEIDAQRFPKLAHEIKTGGLDSVSMGAEAGFTICSYCYNKATDLHDMCDHVRNHKGKTLTRFDKRTGKKEDVLVFESCHKISFFELSYVFEPADETAVASKVVVAGKQDSSDEWTWPKDADKLDRARDWVDDEGGGHWADEHDEDGTPSKGDLLRAMEHGALSDMLGFDPESDPEDPRQFGASLHHGADAHATPSPGHELHVFAPHGAPEITHRSGDVIVPASGSDKHEWVHTHWGEPVNYGTADSADEAMAAAEASHRELAGGFDPDENHDPFDPRLIGASTSRPSGWNRPNPYSRPLNKDWRGKPRQWVELNSGDDEDDGGLLENERDPFDPRSYTAGKYTKEDFAAAGNRKPWESEDSVDDADAAFEIEAMVRQAADCPPGVDCSRNMAQGEQISKDSPNNPVNQVSYDPNGLGQPGAISVGGDTGTPDADNILPGSRALYDALMAEHPGSTIGGYRVDSYGEHARGALDFMTTDEAQAAKVREKAFAAGAPYVIWQQKQWNAPWYNGGGVSAMEDRGDPTQNHFDHVHIAPLDPSYAQQATTSTPAATSQSQGVAPAQRAAWRIAGPTDDYWTWKAEHGEAADKEHGAPPARDNRALKRWLHEQNVKQRRLNGQKTAQSLVDDYLDYMYGEYGGSDYDVPNHPMDLMYDEAAHGRGNPGPAGGPSGPGGPALHHSNRKTAERVPAHLRGLVGTWIRHRALEKVLDDNGQPVLDPATGKAVTQRVLAQPIDPKLPVFVHFQIPAADRQRAALRKHLNDPNDPEYDPSRPSLPRAEAARLAEQPDLWSIEQTDPATGKKQVRGYTNSLHLTDVSFDYNRSGQRQTQVSGKKGVHAGVSGYLAPQPDEPLVYANLEYNPFQHMDFVHRATQKPVGDPNDWKFPRGKRAPSTPRGYRSNGYADRVHLTPDMQTYAHRADNFGTDPQIVFPPHPSVNVANSDTVIPGIKPGKQHPEVARRTKDVMEKRRKLDQAKGRSVVGMKKIARKRALKLAYGEIEAPMAVDTLREEGSAPEDDNDDFERYVDPPQELQTPDLSQAQQMDREQEIAAGGGDPMGQPGPADPTGGMTAPAQPQQQYMTLQIPMPSEAPQVPQAAVPPQAQAPQMPITASLLDYFDNYYGRRVANWLDAIEANRAMTPEEIADYRRQAGKLSTLENGRELSTTDRNPTKGTANMARSTIASRSKVARGGRRQHFAEGPLVDTGDQSRNDQGEQEKAFISQTPPEETGYFPTDDAENISNTEHNLVARVQQGRAQLLRDARQLAALQQRRAFDESGGPVAEVVDPTVNTGPEGEKLTGDDFVSANPNDGVVPTNPKDASLRAFQAFDSWLAKKTGKSSRRHSEASIKKAAAQFSREAGISPQALFPALGIVLREARKSDKQANTKGAKMRKRSNESLEVAAPDGRVDVESPVTNVSDAEAQASQFDIHDFGNNAGDNVAKPDLSTDQNWAPGEASKTGARVKTAGGLLAMRCAEGMIAAGLEPNSRERKYQLAAEFETMNRGLIQDRVALLERFAAVRQADLKRVASGGTRGAARSPIPAGLGGGTRTAAAGPRVAAHDPRNDSSLFI